MAIETKMLKLLRLFIFIGFKNVIACSALIIPFFALAQDVGDAASHASLTSYRPAVPGMHGVVSTANPLASSAGLAILQAGGNAADAAVAVEATLNVVEPQSSGIAGNGYLLFYDKKQKKVYSLAMHAAAPLNVKPEEMDANARSYGMLASTPPGVIGGLIELLKKEGILSLAQVLAPAIDYAKNGHPANKSLVEAIRRQKKQIEHYPTTAAVFMPNGKIPEPGEVFKQPLLAKTLEKLVEAEQQAIMTGASRNEALDAAKDRFYKGDIGHEIADFFSNNGGLISMDDLKNYHPHWGEPLHTNYRGYDVYANAESTRGGIEVLMQLNIVEGFDLKSMGYGSVDSLHLLIESIKLTKADVYKYMADPKTVKVPWEAMLSKQYAENRRRLIRIDAAMEFPEPGILDGEGDKVSFSNNHQTPLPEIYKPDPDTTSFSIADQYGNIVVCTPTIGGGFGAGVVVGNTGLLFNNGMRLGATSPYVDNVNALEPGKVPLLNNSPIIVMKDGGFFLAIGTPGGEGIGQTQFQGIVNVIDYGMDIQQAIEAPRFRLDAFPNFYKPGADITVAMESRFSSATLDVLRRKGHELLMLADYTPGVGGMQAIKMDQPHGTMTGGADPRRAGYVMGW